MFAEQIKILDSQHLPTLVEKGVEAGLLDEALAQSAEIINKVDRCESILSNYNGSPESAWLGLLEEAIQAPIHERRVPAVPVIPVAILGMLSTYGLTAKITHNSIVAYNINNFLPFYHDIRHYDSGQAPRLPSPLIAGGLFYELHHFLDWCHVVETGYSYSFPDNKWYTKRENADNQFLRGPADYYKLPESLRTSKSSADLERKENMLEAFDRGLLLGARLMAYSGKPELAWRRFEEHMLVRGIEWMTAQDRELYVRARIAAPHRGVPLERELTKKGFAVDPTHIQEMSQKWHRLKDRRDLPHPRHMRAAAFMTGRGALYRAPLIAGGAFPAMGIPEAALTVIR